MKTLYQVREDPEFMKPISRLRSIGGNHENRTDQVTGRSYRLAKMLAIGLLVGSILILAPTVFLFGGSPQKQISGGVNPGSVSAPYYSQAVAFAETPALLKAQELQTALESKETPAETLKSKLAELRAARKQAKEESGQE